MYQIYFLPSKNLQIQTTEHQLGSLMNINNIKDTVVRYNKAIENGKLNVKNLKRFELYPLSISGFVFGKDTINII